MAVVVLEQVEDALAGGATFPDTFVAPMEGWFRFVLGGVDQTGDEYGYALAVYPVGDVPYVMRAMVARVHAPAAAQAWYRDQGQPYSSPAVNVALEDAVFVHLREHDLVRGPIKHVGFCGVYQPVVGGQLTRYVGP